MGKPVAGNPTQFMIERAFAAAGLDWRYLTLEVPPEKLEDAVKGLRAMGFRGGNFTIPHKVAVIPFLDELSEAASLMGAVNCVHRVADRLIGENTDGKGFVQSLRSVTEPQGKKVVILGAGGAARAIAVDVGLAGVREIVLVNRSAERGRSLVELLNERVKVPADLVHLSGDYVVESGILRDARGQGCQTLDGLGMLVSQGVIGFKIWTGVAPDPAVMREALEEYLEL